MRRWGDYKPCYNIAEIGINHGGSLQTALLMVEAAAFAGADAVKFQKRTVNEVYTEEDLDRPRESPFGKTNRDLKEGLELSLGSYLDIAARCKSLNLDWGVSPWDRHSTLEMIGCRPSFIKIASPCVTDKEILQACLDAQRKTGMQVILSTGMCTGEIVRQALGRLIPEHTSLMHCVSAYPPKPEDINMKRMQALKHLYGLPVGYSGHEKGNTISLMAVALGACMIERHFTLDCNMWGSDQAMSTDAVEFDKMVNEIRNLEAARGTADIRILDCERPAMDKLRKAAE